VISVVIPAYNAQAYLRECLESVLAQSYTDWEAIVVNDGSTDSTLDIALSYSARDPRIRVISTPNRGQSCARNVGIKDIKGQWLTFLDSDDTLCPEALEKLLSAAAGVDIVVGQFTRNEKFGRDGKSDILTISGWRAVEYCLYQTGISTAVWSKMFKRDIVADITFPAGVYYEDILYCVESFLKARDVSVISDTVYYYRDNPSSFINTFTPKRLDVLRITSMVEGLCAYDHDLLRAARDRRLSANFNIYGLLSVHDREGRYRDVKEQCWQLIKEYRAESLRNPRVRMKNKLGIIVSYMGRGVMGLLSKMMY